MGFRFKKYFYFLKKSLFFLNFTLCNHDENFTQNKKSNNLSKRFRFRNKSWYFKEKCEIREE